jgi:hypothetical protein
VQAASSQCSMSKARGHGLSKAACGLETRSHVAAPQAPKHLECRITRITRIPGPHTLRGRHLVLQEAVSRVCSSLPSTGGDQKRLHNLLTLNPYFSSSGTSPLSPDSRLFQAALASGRWWGSAACGCKQNCHQAITKTRLLRNLVNIAINKGQFFSFTGPFALACDSAKY